MESTNNTKKQKEYDTSINIIGGLRDIAVIHKAFVSYFNEDDSLDELISERNELNLRTERSRIRVERAIRNGFLDFKNQKHIDLCKNYFARDNLLPDSEYVLFWQYALANRLFREITTNVFVKAYFSGRAGLSKEDIIAYLKEFLNQNGHLGLDWSESTISTLATKYLNLMTKLRLLEGARIKSFHHIRLPDESLVLFLYFADLHEPQNRNILKNEFFPLCFVSREEILDRLKEISLKGYFEMSYDGVDLNVDLTTSYQRICDALYNGS